MPLKTDRILGYLPPTFRPSAARSALRAFVDAFGGELQQAENQLAEIMQAHWVDFADRGAPVIDDLARLASLYGLAPRDDESVEAFREHIKRYVRTFLEGTVTVQGILRVTAETLGLTIADRTDELDTWWDRAGDELVTVDTDEADAADTMLGVASADVRGTAARRAEIVGSVDLGSGVDLTEHPNLYLVVDDGEPVVVDLAAAAPDPRSVRLDHIVARVTAEAGPGVARPEAGRLVLASPTFGLESRLEVREGPDDAATAVLGLLPLAHQGRDATRARLVGTVDLAAGADLSETRYLRLLIDGSHLAEIDCAATDPAHTFLDHLRDAINHGLGIDVASHDGHYLSITSPTSGSHSTIAVQRAAAQDASETLFGPALPLYAGEDPQPAQVIGIVDLGEGVDLSRTPLLRLRVDDLPTVTVNCAGAVPERTTLEEVIAAVNSGIGAEVAVRDGRRLRLRSPSTGALAEVGLDPLPDDAAPALLGLPPRLAVGAPATVAHLTGTVSLPGGLSLASRHLLELAVDGGPFVLVDLRAEAGGRRLAALDDLVRAINDALGADVATHDGERLILRSRRTGGGSRLQVRPITVERRRRFVSRAFVTGEASRSLFGVDATAARGDDASQASVTGSPDLSHGVDLTAARYLRVAVDDWPAVDISCAGPRPRATLLPEIVEQINTALTPSTPSGAGGVPRGKATHDGRRLTLTSLTTGTRSRIAFETPEAEDARTVLLDVAPATVFGQNATGVAFVGVADLSAGVDLPAHAAVKLGVDGSVPVEIALTGDEGAHRSLSALAAAINVGLAGSFARHDGTHLAVVSSRTGPGSQVVFEVPAGSDATRAVFGIAAPRSYQGAEATPARLTGPAHPGGTVDLDTARFLALAVDGGAEVVVDCSDPADRKRTTLAFVAAAVNTAMRAAVASAAANRLVLRSVKRGLSGRVTVSPYHGGDARTALFGPDVRDVTVGQPPRPAVITGTVDLLGPVDLSRRSRLRIAVDGGAPREVDVAGASAPQTTLDEVVAALNAMMPSLASATEDRRLRLSSPTVGISSRLDLLPVRSLEVVEYIPVRRRVAPRLARHGDRLVIDHTGAGASFVTVTVRAPQGSAGPALMNFSRGWTIHLMHPVGVGETARLWRAGDGGVRAEVTDAAGRRRAVPPAEVRAGPLGAWGRVPLAGPRPVPTIGLQLDNPVVSGVDLVAPRGDGLTVEVGESPPDDAPLADRLDGEVVEVTGILRRTGGGWQVQDAHGGVLVGVLAGPDVRFAGLEGAVVAVTGVFRLGEPPFVLVRRAERRFDVTLRGTLPDGTAGAEHYERVAIGELAGQPASFAWQTAFGPHPSRLATVRPLAKGDALLLEPGRSQWLVLECRGSRFDEAVFDADTFAGGPCSWAGLFDASLFFLDGDPVTPLFGAVKAASPALEVALEWDHHDPGTFEVNLPADLPPQFGGRFDEATFASAPDTPERYDQAVTEPPGDDRNLVALLNSRSVLVRAERASALPIGFKAVRLPSRRPSYLRGGAGARHARLYLEEKGVRGFVLIEAREEGEVGNLIHVSSRPAGPAQFDVTVGSDGARFETARAIVAGPEAPPLDRSTLAAVPIGIAQAKAAGVHVRVTRDRTTP